MQKWSNWTSGVGVRQKNPTPTPGVARNPTPTPPKNLRLHNPAQYMLKLNWPAFVERVVRHFCSNRCLRLQDAGNTQFHVLWCRLPALEETDCLLLSLYLKLQNKQVAYCSQCTVGSWKLSRSALGWQPSLWLDSTPVLVCLAKPC